MCVCVCVCVCVCMCVCVCVCVCVSMPLRPQITSGMILTLYDWLNNFCYFSVRFMALAIDVIDRRGPRINASP